MKILHVVRQFYPCVGGMEEYVFCLAREQANQGHEVKILTLNKNFQDGSALASDETYENIPIKRISFFGSKRYPLAFSCIRHLGGSDLVHIHGVDFFLDYLALLKIFHKKKIILTTHGGFFHTPFLRILKKVYFYTITRMMLGACEGVIASGPLDFKRFSQISRRVSQVNPGVDPEIFGNTPKKIDRNNLLFVGRLDTHKKIERLISVIGELKKLKIEATLNIAGPDWNENEEKLKSFSQELGLSGQINFLGRISSEELRKEYARAHIFVSASSYEGFGISAIEALASGTACVLNDIPAFSELLSGKECGAVVDFNDAKKSALFVKNILEKSDAEYQFLSAEARELAKSYTWDKVENKISRIYKNVLDPEALPVLGISLDNLSLSSAVEKSMEFLKNRQKSSVFFLNFDCLRLAVSDQEYKKILNDASLVLPDGIGLKLAFWVLTGRGNINNSNGTDFSPILIAQCSREGYSVFLLGGEEGVAPQAAKNLKETFPDLKIAGTSDGYQKDDELLIRRINDSGADVLLVAKGAPLQEKWICKNREKLKPCLCAGVGGLFDYLSGKTRRAPGILQALCLEWFWRVLNNPGRFFKRYFIDGFGFFIYLLVYRFKLFVSDGDLNSKKSGVE